MFTWIVIICSVILYFKIMKITANFLDSSYLDDDAQVAIYILWPISLPIIGLFKFGTCIPDWILDLKNNILDWYQDYKLNKKLIK